MLLPSAYVCRLHHHVGKNVLEIGAGTGLVSAVMSMLGAKEVIATDGDALLLPLLKKNIQKNSPLGECGR